MPRSPFDAVADHYDAARPDYPDAVYDHLEEAAGPLAGQLVLDGGAGTGIASRQLAARGARLVAVDVGERMLRRARAHRPGLCCLLADGNMLPLRDGCADLACFAQSWHWFDHARACAEVGRVLRPGGYWAAWWNRAAAAEDWFAAYRELMATACPGWQARWRHDDSWAAGPIAATGLFEPGSFFVAPWTRTLRSADWLTEERSKSYVAELDPGQRDRVLTGIARILDSRFPDGQMSVPYQTGVWLARRR